MSVKLTKGGITRNFQETPFTKKIWYGSNNYMIYCFSSQMYLNKFIERLEENREKISISLSNRFGVEVRNEVLCDIKLYSSIEKRGFYIKNHKEGFECPENIILDGKRATLKI